MSARVVNLDDYRDRRQHNKDEKVPGALVRPHALAMLLEEPHRAAQVLQRVIDQELAEALPRYWRRRASTFAEVGTSWADGAALACRRHAALLEAERRGVPVLDVLEEVV